MFFALSGYLITGLLIRDLDARGKIQWGRFYAHRLLRLYPALLLLVAMFGLMEVLWDPIGSRDQLGASILIALSYTADLPFAHDLSASISHLWSLAVEEQFYLVWPALLLLGYVRLARRHLTVYLLTLAGIFTAVCWTSAVMLRPADIYQLPTTWVSAMAIGGAAFLAREQLMNMSRPTYGALGALVLAALCFYPNAKDSSLAYFILPTAIAAATIAVIIATERLGLPAGRALSIPLRALAGLGVISYGVYLWNLPIVVWWREASGLGGVWYAATIPLSIAAALVSWYTVEALGRRGRRLFDQQSDRARELQARQPGVAPGR